MTVTTIEKAWEEANKIFPTDYEKDYAASERAGYDIYRHHTLNYYSRICDLGCRLEVITGEYGENVTNIWIVPEEKDTDILGIRAKETGENHYRIDLSNGKRIDIVKDIEYNGSIWEWKIDTQIFSKDEYAKDYLKKLIAEKLTGIRIIYHEERKAPDICGVNGTACRHPGKCNTMLCSDCPVAYKFFAERDGVELVYAIKGVD